MPVYEYRCEKCGKEFEAWQRISDDPIESCSECGGRASKLISQSTFVLKGSGWYVTDYGTRSTASSAGKAVDKPSSTSSTDTSSCAATASE
jgi:putative FmdB family regulatory protein